MEPGMPAFASIPHPMKMDERNKIARSMGVSSPSPKQRLVANTDSLLRFLMNNGAVVALDVLRYMSDGTCHTPIEYAHATKRLEYANALETEYNYVMEFYRRQCILLLIPPLTQLVLHYLFLGPRR